MKRSQRAISFDKFLFQNLRKQKKMSVRKFADLCKISYSQVSEYEKGKTIPTHEMIERLTTNLGLPPGYFFAENEESSDIISLRDALIEDLAEMKKADLSTDQIRALRSVIKLIRSALNARTSLSN